MKKTHRFWWLNCWILLLCFSFFSEKTVAQNGCNFKTGDAVTFQVSGQNTGGNYTQHYVLTNSGGVIQYSNASLPFTGVSAGQYLAYAVNYDNTQTAPTLTNGTNISAIGGDCVELAGALSIGVCDCNNTTGDLSFTQSGQNTGGDYTQIYALTNGATEIISTHNSSPITGLSEGTYNVYPINYDNTQTAPTLTAGTKIANIGGDCVEVFDQFGRRYSIWQCDFANQRCGSRSIFGLCGQL